MKECLVAMISIPTQYRLKYILCLFTIIHRDALGNRIGINGMKLSKYVQVIILTCSVIQVIIFFMV